MIKCLFNMGEALRFVPSTINAGVLILGGWVWGRRIKSSRPASLQGLGARCDGQVKVETEPGGGSEVTDV